MVIRERLLDQRSEWARMKQRPPIARNVGTAVKMLRFTADDVRDGDRRRRRLGGVLSDIRSRRPCEIRPDDATNQEQRAQRCEDK